MRKALQHRNHQQPAETYEMISRLITVVGAAKHTRLIEHQQRRRSITAVSRYTQGLAMETRQGMRRIAK